MQYLFPLLLLCLTLACADDDESGPSGTSLPLVIVPNGFEVDEGTDGPNELTIAVRAEGSIDSPITLTYQTAAGTAEAGSDFTAIPTSSLTLTAGQPRRSFVLTVAGDDAVEADEELQLVFSVSDNARLNVPSTTITLRNDDQDQTDPNPYGIPEGGYTSADSYAGKELVWEEDFSGNALNETDWNYEIGTGSNGWGNNELQYYQPDNTILDNGHLIIEARQESVNGQSYTSSRLTTMNKQSFKYGRIDIRAALPEGQGIWPALWMLGANFEQVGWPGCGEIDITELVGHEPGKVHGTAHYGVSGQSHDYKGESTSLPNGEKFSDAFHVFSIDWEPNKIVWLVDDAPFFTLTPASVGGNQWRFNNDFFFIVNVAVGGNWPGAPNSSTVFPQRLYVDYIRVFQ